MPIRTATSNVYSYGCLFPSSGVPATSGGTKCKQYSRGDTGYRALRGSLRFNPSDRLDILLSADYIQSSHNNGAEVLLYGNNGNPNSDRPTACRSTGASSAASGAITTPLGQPAAIFGHPAAEFPLPATSGQQLNTFDAGALRSTSRSASPMLKLNSITGYHNWTNSSASTAICPRPTPVRQHTLDH